MKEKSIKPLRFIISYMAVLLPMIILSAAVSQWNIARSQDRNESAIRDRLAAAAQQLVDMQTSYNNKAARIYSKTALSYKNMTSNFSDAQAGADLLKDIQIMDDLCIDFYMYYKTGEMYSARGYTHSDIYLGDWLGCDAISYNHAVFEIESDVGSVLLLTRENESNAYLLNRYPVTFGEQTGITSVTFVVALNDLMKEFQQMDDLPYIVRITDDVTAAAYRFADGKYQLLHRGGFETAQADTKTYQHFSHPLPSLGLTVDLLYPCESIATDVRESQYWNYGLVAVGIFLSTLLSLWIGGMRWKKIKQLEDFISGNDTGRILKAGDEFHYLREKIREKIEENDDMRRHIRQYRAANKEQLMHMLLAGMFTDREEFNRAASKSGLVLMQSHYFLIGVLMRDPAALERFETLLEHDLSYRITVRDTPALVMVAELLSADLSLEHRMNMVHQLKTILHNSSMKTVKICFSGAYRDLDMMNCAFHEITEMLERQVGSDDGADEICAWETSPVEPASLLDTSEADLQKLSAALQSQNERAAMQQMDKLIRQIHITEISPANKRYLRYAIQQTLVRQLNRYTGAERDVLLNDALSLDPAQEKTFDRAATRLAQRYCRTAVGTDDTVKKVLNYIEKKYTDCTLSAETIADYVGLNKVYLSRIFKQKTGFSYIDFLSRLRMEKAVQLLHDTNLTVKEVVERVGYLDESSFRKKFRTVYGITLSEFRAQKKESVPDFPNPRS